MAKPKKPKAKVPKPSKGDIEAFIIAPSEEWKYATTVKREDWALKLGSAYFNKDENNILTSPASPYPERQRVLPRGRLKPKPKEE
jgi:hypothetical protein